MPTALRPLLLIATFALALPAWAEEARVQRAEVGERIREVERDGGRVLRAERMQRGGEDVYRIKVLTPEGRVRVLDFGIARTLDGEQPRTRTQLHALTPEYAAPEQFSAAPPSTAVDVYGAGALLYKLLAGVPPR